jgi:hypothetical protein
MCLTDIKVPSLYLDGSDIACGSTQKVIGTQEVTVGAQEGTRMSKRSDTDISQRGSVLSQPQMTAAGSPRIPVQSNYAAGVLGPTVITGAGMSLMIVPIAAATIGIEHKMAGLASGLINAARQVGGAIGLAVLVTVAASVAHGSGLSSGPSVVHGYRTAFVISAAVSLASAIIAAFLPARTKPAPTPVAAMLIPTK